jgi:hypothetical protein
MVKELFQLLFLCENVFVFFCSSYNEVYLAFMKANAILALNHS